MYELRRSITMWRRRSTYTNVYKHFSSASESESQSLYSFLHPSLFSLNHNPFPPPPPPPPSSSHQQELTSERIHTLESTLHESLVSNNTDEAWKSFKSLTSNSKFPSKPLTNSLIAHLSALADTHNLKRAFACSVHVIEKNPTLLNFDTAKTVLESMKCANTSAPAFSLIKCMFKNRYFMPFLHWGNLLVEISRKNGSFVSFLRVFEESCRIAIDEKLDFMIPDLVACNAALEGCCFNLESISDAEKVVETMSVLGIRPNESSLGFLAYLYAIKDLKEKVIELHGLFQGLGFSNKWIIYSNLIRGHLKAGNLELACDVLIKSLSEEKVEHWKFGDEVYCEIVKAFMKNGKMKDLAGLILETQKLEPSTVEVDKSVGSCIITACINLGFSNKAHDMLDEMNSQGGSLGLGVYLPILKAYIKEHRTTEATQLVMEISNSGSQLDISTYDSLIEASIMSQDFQSALTLFRDMREARMSELNGSYLTIMTGLMENHRPELMAAFLDEIVEDPRIEVKTHDWNSIIHAFCKAGRLEDARRTLKRMIFLQFEPNDQTYLSLINGYVTSEKYFSVLMLWNEVKRRIGEKGIKFDHHLVEAFLYAFVKGGFFDAVMQVVEKSQEMKIFVDKWRYKQAFMEAHKKLHISKLRKRNVRKMEALIAFKNWAGLNS